MYIENILELVANKTGFQPVKRGANYSAKCPAHDDHNPSLSISCGEDGKILFHCFAGCSAADVCASLKLEVKALFQNEFKLHVRRTEYFYRNESGELLYKKVRLEPGSNGKSKSFFWERTTEKGEVVKNLKGCKKVLYRLPELIQGIFDRRMIFLVEGEKDADRLIKNSCLATTSSESLFWDDEYTKLLTGADIVLLYDNDITGLKRRDLLIRRLNGKVRNLRVIDLPGIEFSESHGKDISDWLDCGNTIENLLELVEETPFYAQKQTSKINGIRLISLDDFLNLPLPPREKMLSPFLPTQGLALLYAKRGVGKTHVAMGIAYAVATGTSFLNWSAPIPRKVVYIDGEMPAVTMQERFRKIVNAKTCPPPPEDFLRLITPDLQEGAMPNLSSPEDRLAIENSIRYADLVIIDNVSTLFRTGIENDATSWAPAQEWALKLRKDKKSVLFVHHAGKGGQQRGTSKKEDILDSVICLRHPNNYNPEDGACFEVHYEKAREFTGKEASPFRAKLVETENQAWDWSVTDLDIDPEVIEISQFMLDGLTIEQMCAKTGLSKSKVETRMKKARKAELVD
jgi:hypothetical protein